jgi:hypothetical protein
MEPRAAKPRLQYWAKGGFVMERIGLSPNPDLKPMFHFETGPALRFMAHIGQFPAIFTD